MKILYISTVAETINSFLVPHIERLISDGHTVDIACNLTIPIDPRVVEWGCHIFDVPMSRQPLRRSNLQAIRDLRRMLLDEKYDIIHTHTPVASVLIRLANINKQSAKILYTAHGFHFFRGAPLRNWLMYYPIELMLSSFTDTLITINSEDFRFASTKLNAKKTTFIPGVGINVESISKIQIDKDEIRNQLGVPKDCVMVVSVGELNSNKNHETIVKAMAQLKDTDIHYVVCGVGNLFNQLVDIGENLGLQDRIHLLGYRKDVFEIYKAADLFVFPSLREGLPVSVMEAMAAGLPIVASNIRGNVDLVDEGAGGFLIQNNDVLGYAEAIMELKNNLNLRKKFGSYNARKASQFALEEILEQYITHYD